ncbi:hypothetical protein EU545_00500 [Candidatus Thorarchaeota archaeon]|nr:MAG: hypothetical protein EU545_00500 [Candidatus Thorarchaeota archaeon]
MPKRARCPYCDRLFSRDALDNHIQKCRQRRRKTMSAHPRRRLLVVDGNNVAFYLSSDGTPHVRNLILARNSLLNAGYRPSFVISAALVHRIDKPESLRSFISEAQVTEVPRRTNDDLKIIQMAQNTNADIVSNDRFLNWLEKYPWVSDRLRRYRMTPAGLILI